MDARIVARKCLTECSETPLLLPGISPLSLLLLLLVTVCKKGGKTIEPIPVPSVSKAVVHGVGGFLWCPHCYLVPINKKSCVRKSPRGLSAMSFLYSFASLPNLTLTLGRQWVEASAWRTRPESAHLSRSRWLLLSARQRHTADPLSVQHVSESWSAHNLYSVELSHNTAATSWIHSVCCLHGELW